MALDGFHLTAGTLLAMREGVSQSDAFRFGLVAAILPQSTVGLILVQQLARREVANTHTPGSGQAPPNERVDTLADVTQDGGAGVPSTRVL